MIIHDLNLASMFCDKLLMLKDGSIFAYGDTASIVNEENILSVYNVNTKITIVDGNKHVRLLRK